MIAPMRRIVWRYPVSIAIRRANPGGLGHHWRRVRRWMLSLDCGHRVERPLGFGLKSKRARCQRCKSEAKP